MVRFGINFMPTAPPAEIVEWARAVERYGLVMADIDLALSAELRALWGHYQNRRPDLYAPLLEKEAEPVRT